MPLPEPFAYPTTFHRPIHGPAGYTDYGSYKPWIRDDFAFRCVYCLTRERWDASPSGHASFGADHVEAQSVAPAMIAEYRNLVYACNSCNSAKRNQRLGIDPRTDAMALLLSVDAEGIVQALAPDAELMIDVFDLNEPGRISLRLEKLVIVRSKQTHPEDGDIDHLFRRAFGYPDDLPDLSLLRPPGGNALRGSESLSHFARRERGELADVY
jgi:hypothetical protein